MDLSALNSQRTGQLWDTIGFRLRVNMGAP
jgi:hypothetical protein